MKNKTGLIYFEDGDLIAEHESARVYKMNDELFLELGNNHTLWALSSELEDYIWQLNDKPFGDCLEIGLGLGVASKYILSCPRVKTLTTVEVNNDVIEVNKIINTYNKNHTIINCDGLLYPFKTKKIFDFVFIDCYDRIDEDTLPFIRDMVNVCKFILKKNGKIICWFDKYTPEEFVDEFYNIFKFI